MKRIFPLIILSIIVLSGCAKNKQIELLEKQNNLLQTQMIQQKITNDKSRVEGRLIEIYKNECNKGYNGFSDQYIKLMNEYCKNDMNEVCVQKFHNTYPNVVPTSKDVFVKECISRKQENLPTFDEGIK